MNISLNKRNLLNYVILGTIVFLAVWCLMLCFSSYINGDEKEHLYASFLITKGDVPYRDFFEHHHPLLWYLFSPIVIFLSNSENVLYAMRLFSYIVLSMVSCYIYKISFCLTKDIKASLLAVLVYLLFPGVRQEGILFRPDNLMMLFYLAGFYYYFKYVEFKDVGYLCLSFGLFLLSFMSLQKVVILLLPFVGVIFYHIKKYQLRIKDLCVAVFVSLFLFVAFLGSLYYNDALKDYFETSWLLNFRIKFTYSIIDKIRWVEIVLCGIICAIALIFLKNNKIKDVALLGTVLTIMMVIFNPPYMQYLLVVYPYFAILLGYALSKMNNNKLLFWVICVLCFVLYGIVNLVSIYPKKPYNFRDAVKLERVILLNSSENDYIIGCEDLTSGSSLRRNIAGYYWFSYVQMAQMDYKIFKRHEFPLLNEIVKVRKPKIVCGGDWGDCLNENLELVTPCRTSQYLDKQWLREHYSPVGSFFVRRD